MSEDARKPQAFRLEPEPPPKTKAKRSPRAFTDIEFEPADSVAPLAAAAPTPLLSPKSFRWGAIFISACLGLISIWAGLSITKLIEDLFARSEIFGWIASGLAALAGLAAIAIIVREIWGLIRLNHIEGLQTDAAHALNFNDRPSGARAIAALRALYAGRPDTALGLKLLKEHEADIIDPADRIRIAASALLVPLDAEAHRIIARAARRVTLLTTVTPAAVLDILFVAAQNLRMIRELATLYGGRPSVLATLRLARMVMGHLAVTGGLALSDSLVQHVVGKGLIGRLSARFGEGTVNGILTARIGLAALDVCRPIPQDQSTKETLSSLLREVVSFDAKVKEEAQKDAP